MDKQEIQQYVNSAEEISGQLGNWVEENGIVGLAIAIKLVAKEKEEPGASAEWFIENLIIELKKDYGI